MKNTCVLFVCILALATAVSCSGESSSSSSSAFKIQPGDVTKFDSTISGTSYDVNFHGPQTGDYAIIFQKNINGTDYVGIAFGEDPKSNRSFKCYIYFTITSPNLIDTFNNINAISVFYNGKKFVKKNDTDTISLTITESSGLYEINSNSNSNSTNSIQMTNGTDDVTFNFSGNPDIKAYLVQ